LGLVDAAKRNRSKLLQNEMDFDVQEEEERDEEED
jgi:hypothetical protein